MAGTRLAAINKAEERALFAEVESIDPEKHIIVKLQLVPTKGLKLDQAALRVLLILCTRTMAVLPHEEAAERVAHAGRILQLDERTGAAELAIPTELVRPDEGLSHLFAFLTSAAEYGYCDEYWIDNVQFPRSYVDQFEGPRFGVQGMRSALGLSGSDRPIVGVIAKPRSAELRRVVEAIESALRGGCDFVCDDLLMVAPVGEMNFESRVRAFATLTRDLTRELKQKKSYIANVSTSVLTASRLAEIAIKTGADALLVNGFAMSFGGMKEFVDFCVGKVPVVTSNMGAGMISRPRLMGQPGKPTGMSETVLSKFSRMAGADGAHAGTAASECYGEDVWGPATRALRAGLHHLKPCMAVAEGDLNVANLWENIQSLGRDVMLEPTSGILAAGVSPAQAAACFRALAERLYPDMTDRDAHTVTLAAAKKIPTLAKLLDHFDYQAPAGAKVHV